MAFCEIHLFSESLRMQTTVNVIIPQQRVNGEIGISANTKQKKYKCLYLLHGLSDDQSIWMRRTSIERYATEYGIAIVMPFGGRSFYTDMKYGGKYYTYISEELPKLMQEFFHISDKREDNYIAGNSMGGYGALKIGMKKCEKFSAVAGLSSVADIVGSADRFADDIVSIFGEEMNIPDSENLFKIADKTDNNPQKPRVFMGVGADDFLYESNVKLREKFKSLSFDFTYRESAGTHNWGFWGEYIQYVLEWMIK